MLVMLGIFSGQDAVVQEPIKPPYIDEDVYQAQVSRDLSVPVLPRPPRPLFIVSFVYIIDPNAHV
jgi:hypothetical protein